MTSPSNNLDSPQGAFSWARRGLALAAIGAAGVAFVALCLPAPREAGAAPPKSMPAPVAPELKGRSWLNTPGSKPITLESRRGTVTIVQFWTFGCSNCRANLPSYEKLQKQFGPRGVEIIGVHTPESDHERDPENVARQVKELNITHPVLLDPQGENWRRWGQKYWPTLYVLDHAGRVRGKWEGELEYRGAGNTKKVAALVESLLREPKPTAQSAAPTTPRAAKPDKKGVGRVERSEAEWKKILSATQFEVLRKKGTEAPYSGDSKPKKKPGTFACAGCGLKLFTASKMFDSGTGWPSFWQPIAGHVREHADADGERVEVLCARCDGHLGHVFPDGPQPTGLRYCMNAVAMKFAAKK